MMKSRTLREKIEGRNKSVSSANPLDLQGDIDPATSLNDGNRSGNDHSCGDVHMRIAYGLCVYARHGREDGHDIDDWIEAVNGDS
jgi:hypothetical protein